MRRIGVSRRVQELQRTLVLAVREAVQDMVGSIVPSAPLELEIRCKISPKEGWKIACERSFEEQIKEAIEDVIPLGPCGLSPGRVFCYRCETSQCQHSYPPSPGSVFGGYAPTGLPRWVDFHQLLLEQRHPGVEAVFDPKASDLLALCVDGESLRENQLEAFGRLSGAYSVIGQVIFGPVRIGDERVAVTVQVVEYRGNSGGRGLDVNVLACIPQGGSVSDVLQEVHKGRIWSLLSGARKRVQWLGARKRRAGADTWRYQAIQRVLRNLARRLERMGRQMKRRTGHAQNRSLQSRPTHKALEDLACAPKERILWDEVRNTVIVLGECGRVHVLGLNGKHITSFSLNGESIDNRLKRGRWRPLEGDLLEKFSDAVKQLIDQEAKGREGP